jgi:hypothetical protein
LEDGDEKATEVEDRTGMDVRPSNLMLQVLARWQIE